MHNHVLSSNRKPRILIFVLNYLPGYRAGGVLRTIVNTVNWLKGEFDFLVVTRDRDLGSDEPYVDVDVNHWQHVEGAMVRYVAPDALTTGNLVKLLKETPHDIIHLNSFFDPVFTIRLLLARKIGRLPRKPLIVSPRGEFGNGSLSIKYPKKLVFMLLARLLGLYRDVVWHVSSKHELQDLVNVMKVAPQRVETALDLPCHVTDDATCSSSSPENGTMSVVYLSRLSREKNLHVALSVLQQVKANIAFDIYGPKEDLIYWKECQELIGLLPPNIAVDYRGPVAPNDVAKVFGRYDLFLFPTSGENYGHVIAESISAGTLVLVSNNTPWADLESDGLGWCVDLDDEERFARIIEEQSLLSVDERQKKRKAVREAAPRRLLDPAIIQDNLQLYRKRLGR